MKLIIAIIAVAPFTKGKDIPHRVIIQDEGGEIRMYSEIDIRSNNEWHHAFIGFPITAISQVNAVLKRYEKLQVMR